MNLIEKKEIEIDGKVFIISKFPAISGREIIAGYPLTGLPKIGDYKENESIMLKLMSYVAVPVVATGGVLLLTTSALIDNHVGSWETLMKIEKAMLEYNCSFFQNGRVSTFLKDVAQNMPSLILEILTALSARLSPMEKQH